MADINVVTLSGRLTRDSEARFSTSGVCVLKFSLAVNTRKKDTSSGEWREEANFFDIVVFGKRAEALQNYLVKGFALVVTGELRQDRWESDGQSRSRVSILANNVMFMGGANTAAGIVRKGSVVQDSESNVGNIAELQEAQIDSSDANSFQDDIPF